MQKTKGIRISPTNKEKLKDAQHIKKEAIASGVYDKVKIIARGTSYHYSTEYDAKFKVQVFEVKGYDNE